MFPSRYISCNECGAAVERREHLEHECDRERLVQYQLFRLDAWLDGRLEDPDAQGRGGDLDGS